MAAMQNCAIFVRSTIELAKMPALEGISGDEAEAARLAVLRLLAQHPQLSQRELSGALGVSLGKAHYILHALLDKGLLKVRNFRRNDNKVAYAYVLTPRGLSEKLRMTRSFLRRKEIEFDTLRCTIESLRSELSREMSEGQ
jgi:EPS-associated MarR family transcriptional regulator